MLCHRTISAAKSAGVPLTAGSDVVEDVEPADVEDRVVDAVLSVVEVVLAGAVEDPVVAGSLVVLDAEPESPVVELRPAGVLVAGSTVLVGELSDGGETG